MRLVSRRAALLAPLMASLLAWAPALLVAGCASPSPDLYSLEPRPGAVRTGPVLASAREARQTGTQTGARRVIVVRGVGLPRYLEREEIVRSAGGTRLHVAGNDWWGEPLRAMLRRVLVADLAQRLPGADVLADEGPIAAHPDAEVEVDVQRFDRDPGGRDPGGRDAGGRDPDGRDPDGPVLLDGYAAVTAGPGRPRTLDRLRLGVPVAASTTKAQVDAMSAALGQVAGIIAGRLAP